MTHSEHTPRNRAEWRVNLGHAMEGTVVSLIILALLIVDVTCVAGELIIALVCLPELAEKDAEIARLQDALANATGHTDSHSSHARALLLQHQHQHQAATTHHSLLRGLAASNEDGAHGTTAHSYAHEVENVLHVLSLVILSIFMVHLVALFVAFGPWSFFRHIVYPIDTVIVVTAITLESLHEPTGELVVLLLFWRVLRVLHGVMASELVAIERVDHVKKRLRAVRKRLAVARGYTASTLRLLAYRDAARLIQTWWRRVQSGEMHESIAAASATAQAAQVRPRIIRAPSTLTQRLRTADLAAGGHPTPVAPNAAAAADEREEDDDDGEASGSKEASSAASLGGCLRGVQLDEAVEDAAAAARYPEGHHMRRLPRDEHAHAQRTGQVVPRVAPLDDDEKEDDAAAAAAAQAVSRGSSAAGGGSTRRLLPLHEALDHVHMDDEHLEG